MTHTKTITVAHPEVAFPTDDQVKAAVRESLDDTELLDGDVEVGPEFRNWAGQTTTLTVSYETKPSAKAKAEAAPAKAEAKTEK